MATLPERGCSGWMAELRLQFERRDDRTVLAHRWHRGPLQVQRPFYPEPTGVCHLYLLHPPGGVVPGDRLHIEARLEEGAEVLLTTPASGKIYRSHGPVSGQTTQLCVGARGALEWFPQETIVFDQAQTERKTLVELADQDAHFTGWEILCLGRPACEERFTFGNCKQAFEIWREGRPLWVERSNYEGGAALLEAPWGLRGHPVVGTFVCVARAPGLIERVREICGEVSREGRHLVPSQLQDVLVVRYLGDHVDEAKAYFTKVWAALRPMVTGRAVSLPRIWRT